MSHDPVSGDPTAASGRRRVLAFGLLGLLVLVVVLGLLRPDGPASGDPPATAAELDWGRAPALLLAGLCTGLLAGMTRMGGGVPKIAFMLILLHFDFYFARAVALATLFLESVMVLRGFLRAGLVVWPVASRMLLLAVPASVVAALLGNWMPPAILALSFGVFCLFLALHTAAFIPGDSEERDVSRDGKLPLDERGRYQAGVLGGLHGTICGLFGVSGGVIATPLQQVLLHVPRRNAVANTLLVATVVTLVAGAIVMWTGIAGRHFTVSDVLIVDVCMGSGSAAGVAIGKRLAEHCSVTGPRLLLALFTGAAGLYLVL